MKMKSRIGRSLLLGASIFSSGCSIFNSNLNGEVSYLDSVKQNFEAGEKALADKSYEDAIAYFEHVRSKYPYSIYAALSDLRLADTYFYQSKWLEAADAYDFYLRFHPRHEKSGYAWFQIGKSYFNAQPENLFIFPPSYLKDQTATKEALEAIDRYLVEYPTHEKIEEAKKMRTELRLNLGLRDMKIAEYYANRKRWPAAVSRYERVAALYSDTACAPESLFIAARIAEHKLNKPQIALSLLEKLLAQYSKSRFIDDAKKIKTRLVAATETVKEPEEETN
jgi:outer membrane protein assembly factor BamD